MPVRSPTARTRPTPRKTRSFQDQLNREAGMRRLWLAFAVVVLSSFAVLGWVGTRIYQQAPPLPDKVVTPDGKVVIHSGEIEKGQNVWQAMGGMEVGSIWGHGSYVAPD